MVCNDSGFRFRWRLASTTSYSNVSVLRLPQIRKNHEVDVSRIVAVLRLLPGDRHLLGVRGDVQRPSDDVNLRLLEVVDVEHPESADPAIDVLIVGRALPESEVSGSAFGPFVVAVFDLLLSVSPFLKAMM